MIIENFYYHKSSPLYLNTKSATVADMAESLSIWSMRTPKIDSVGRVWNSMGALIRVYCTKAFVTLLHKSS